MEKNVVVYSQPGWMYCRKVKEFLSQQGVQFTERNISTDPDAVNDLRRLGAMTLPLTLIDSETLTGFDEEKFKQILNK